MEYSDNFLVKRTSSDTKYSQMMAEAFHTDHNYFNFDPEDYYQVHKKATWHLEKPIELTTPSLYLLHRKIKDHVTVVLSGEGADELFAGYFFFLDNIKDGNLT